MLVLLVFIELFFAPHCKGISAGVQVELAETTGGRDFPRTGAVGCARGPDWGAFARRLGQNYDPKRALLRSHIDGATGYSSGTTVVVTFRVHFGYR